MLLVDEPVQYPACCAASLRSEDPEGFVDTTQTMSIGENRVYLSVSWLRDCAREVLGLVDPGELQDAISVADQRISDLEAELAQADRQLEAVHTLKKAGFSAQRKPGRKPNRAVSDERE